MLLLSLSYTWPAVSPCHPRWAAWRCRAAGAPWTKGTRSFKAQLARLAEATLRSRPGPAVRRPMARFTWDDVGSRPAVPVSADDQLHGARQQDEQDQHAERARKDEPRLVHRRDAQRHERDHLAEDDERP